MSFPQDKHDSLNNEVPGIWTSRKPGYISSPLCHDHSEAFVWFILPAVGMQRASICQVCRCVSVSVRVWVCVCVWRRANWIHSSFALKPLTQLSQHSGKCHFGNTTFFIYEQSGGGKNLTDKSAAASSEELTRSRRGEVRCVRMKLTVEWDLTREWEAVKHNDTAATMRRREETGAAKWTGDGGQRDDKQS